MIDVTNHLVPWTTVKKLLKGAWGEAYVNGWKDALNEEATTLTPNPYAEDK